MKLTVKELLLEIGMEEIPAGYMPDMIRNLKDLAQKKTEALNLKHGVIQTWGTPRRLVLYIEELSEAQDDQHIENRGPKKNIAFDSQGKPAKPGLGFAKAQKMDFDDLVVKEVEGIEYVFALKTVQGQNTIAIIPGLLQDLILSLPFPKTMRWGYSSLRFARPLRWLLAFWGEELVAFNTENLSSGAYTFGHRVLSSGKIAVGSIKKYFSLLPEHYVILDQNQRRNLIKTQLQQAAAQVKGKPVENEELLEEVNFLVEYPTVFTGSFSTDYLQVPPEVLTTSMIEHQRYFPVLNDKGGLMPYFIGVRNGNEDYLDIVRTGNERVLKARLEDALFFWNEDRKKPLEEVAKNLDKVTYHERLGSLQDKVERLTKLVADIGNDFSEDDRLDAKRAALLCKADLLTNMVYEFPELQGIMGCYYARLNEEKETVARAVLEHYLPRFAGDDLPQSSPGVLLSLAEKIDSLAAFFTVGLKPSGSQDPYALRRQALGIISIILDKKLNLRLEDIFGYAYDIINIEKKESGKQEIIGECLNFLRQRLRGTLLDSNYSYDVIDAVLALSLDNINDIAQRTEALREFKEDENFQDFIVVFNRAHNLSKKWQVQAWQENILFEKSELILLKEFKEVKLQVFSYLDISDYTRSLQSVASLREAMDEFFTQVMVMVENESLQNARLGMLHEIAALCFEIADFSKLVY
ncbi:MAG: glycine--tRNA ligase subunit beta [Syntrophomonadaceae bacterium]|jgi:glycyl-tRNA synthetase beta chain|nr:glycine--tRNA ligase subunit beta [Syntrophomonadaceae bacterium]